MTSIWRTCPFVIMAACAPAADDGAQQIAAVGPAEWRVAEQPRVSIGLAEGDERYQLVSVTSAFKQSDGRIVVLDAGRSLLVFFDSAGKWQSQSGGRGRGPGEMERGVFAWPYVADSIALFDLSQQRLSVFDARGNYVRGFRNPLRLTRRPGVVPSESCCVIGLSFVTGAFVGVYPPEVPINPGPPRFSMLTLIRLSAEGVVQDTIGTYESAYIYLDAGAPSGYRHYETSYDFRFVVVSDAVIGGNGLAAKLVVARPGAAVDSIPIPGEPRPFTAELKAEYEQALRADYANRGRQSYEGTLQSNLPHEYAAVAPRFVNLKCDADGHIWSERWTPRYGRFGAPRDYEVISNTGAHVATISVPPKSRFLWAGRGQILLLERDSLDVQYVRLYDIAGHQKRSLQ